MQLTSKLIPQLLLLNKKLSFFDPYAFSESQWISPSLSMTAQSIIRKFQQLFVLYESKNERLDIDPNQVENLKSATVSSKRSLVSGKRSLVSGKRSSSARDVSSSYADDKVQRKRTKKLIKCEAQQNMNERTIVEAKPVLVSSIATELRSY